MYRIKNKRSFCNVTYIARDKSTKKVWGEAEVVAGVCVVLQEDIIIQSNLDLDNEFGDRQEATYIHGVHMIRTGNI